MRQVATVNLCTNRFHAKCSQYTHTTENVRTGYKLRVIHSYRCKRFGALVVNRKRLDICKATLGRGIWE